MMLLLPFERYHTAVTTPEESTATRGSAAVCPLADRSTGLCQLPPEKREAWMMYLLPSKRCHTAVTTPDESTAT